MGDFAGFPRDQRAAWNSYDMAPQSSPSSHRKSWSGYSQPYDYRPLSDGYEGISHKRDRDSTDGSQHHQSAIIRRNHEYSRLDTESSRRTHSVSSESRRGHKKVSRNAYRDQDAIASNIPYDHSHHTSSRTMSSATFKNREASNESGHRANHKDRHLMPVPPKAPKIPRLPTPDFDDVEYSKYDMSDHQFCACCGDDGSSGAEHRRGECTAAKMERQGMSPRSFASLIVGYIHKYLV
ncbi:hypothetical protein F4813DRAFT_391843 [Daldinia decipiens]|uniref:uncharacterized protein n=1 Tax=Daldinia decipiens TaxID=326647 RepID=UPI0020C2D94A|nr:uncharacterized protein F4813DRAFT_391843 [Daldinia decipiens]KAI1655417.1 hypothetical protein F4813DRAFT_391843 [Daldinia decipiens]